MTKLQLVHDRNPANAGDIASVPTNYFDFGEVLVRHITEVETIDSSLPTIVGGGGLLCHRPQLQTILSRAAAPVVGWGIGLNAAGGALADSYPEWCNLFSLLGVRDAGVGRRWVPCASCMSPLFDQEWNAMHPVVAYMGMPFDTAGVPWMHCCGGHDFRRAVQFLASGETIVTSSYHGLYWGLLLGRRVVCVPNHASSKFYHLPFPVPLVNEDRWREHLRDAIMYSGALAICRAATREFSEDVRQLLTQW